MKKICVIQQDSNDCGVACVATILKTYKVPVEVNQLRSITRTDKYGTTAYGIREALNGYGFHSQVLKGTEWSEEIILPCIAHLVLENGLHHYVVVYKVSKKTVVFADPAKGIVSEVSDEFFDKWTGIIITALFDRSALVVIDKSNKFKLSNLMKGNIPIFVLLFLASLIYTILGICGSFFFKLTIDDYINSFSVNNIRNILILFMLIYIFYCFLDFFRNYVMIYLSKRIDINLITSLYKKMISIDYLSLSKWTTGDLVTRFNDTEKIRNFISVFVVSIVLDGLLMVSSGIVIFYQNKNVFLVCIGIAFFYVLIFLIFYKVIERTERELLIENANLTSYIVDSISGLEFLKLHNVLEYSNQIFEIKFIKFLSQVFKIESIEVKRNLLRGLVKYIGGLIIVYIGVIEIINARLTVGALVTINALLLYFVGPIDRLLSYQKEREQTKVSLSRYSEIYSEPEFKNGKLSFINGDIEFNNVEFSYNIRRTIIKNISFTLTKGSHLFIVGESGSGKSTILSILSKLYKPNNGEVKIAGVDIFNVDNDEYLERVGYVSQNLYLPFPTIYENIVGNRKVDERVITKVINGIGLDKVFTNLENGLYTVLENGGSNLSAGERQKVLLASILVKNVDILLLDEVTSFQDEESEKQIMNFITNNYKGKTIIQVVHKLELTNYGDKVLLVKDGEIT